MTEEKIMEDFGKLRSLVDEHLRRLINRSDPLLDLLVESIEYTLFSGGKRVRPLFCFAVGEIFDVPVERLITTACALEMIHTASLIMDDLPHMDDATTRRGKPANHLVYGQDVAALASIGLLTKAYEVVLADEGLSAEMRAAVVEKLANVVGLGGLVGGQFVDLKLAAENSDPLAIEYIHTRKTASLFVASGTIAAMIGDASQVQIDALSSYANHLGFAFQILDDLLDVDGDETEVGKTLHSDRISYVKTHGVKESREYLNRHTAEALEAIDLFGDRNAKLAALCHILLRRRS